MILSLLPALLRTLPAGPRRDRPFRRSRREATASGPRGAVLRRLSLLPVLPALVLSVLALAGPMPAQGQQQARQDQQEPAAASGPPATLLVEAVDDSGDVLGDLEPGALRVLREGEPLAITTSQQTGPDGVVVYFDLPLLSTQQVLAAASTLSDRAASLVRVGDVEVVVGDSDTRTALPPTGDPEIVSQSLAGVGTRYGGRDALVEVRTRFLEELRALAGPPAGAGAPRTQLQPDRLDRIERLAAGALLEEADLLRRQRERLVTWAAEEGSLGPRHPKALILVTGGFDADPLPFYRRALAAHGLERQVADRLERPVVLPSLDELGRVLAAYGWLTDPYVSQGLGHEDETAPPPAAGQPPTAPSAGETLGRPGLDASEAGDDQRPALITPKLGRRDKADQEKAAALPPARPDAASLVPLAAATGGEVITDPLQIETLLRQLAGRLRLDVPAPAGEPERIDVELAATGRRARNASVRFPHWIGATPPRSVAAVRVRKLLDGARPEQGDLPVEAVFATPPRGVGEGRLTVRLGSPGVPAPPPGTPLRATIGIDRTEGDSLVFHRELAVAPDGGDTFDVPVTLPEGAETRLAVLVEELPDGGSGSAFASYVQGGVGSRGGQAGEGGASDEAADAYLPSPRIVRLLAPGQAFVVGETTFTAVVSTPQVQRVDFLLDGKRVAARVQSPFQAVIDVGTLPERRSVEAVAYDADGQEMGRDTLVINQGGGSFRVRIVEPRAGSWSDDKPLVGPVDVEADVTAPGDARIDQVEFYWGSRLVATSYAPPYRQRVIIPADDPQGFLRVVAQLEDGATAEDVLFVNSPGTAERLDVNLVEMYVVVTDKQGHPVDDLTEDDFRVYEEGEPQTISTFRAGADLPLTVGLAIDSSASMFVKLPGVAEAASEFVRDSLDDGDRAFVVGFGGEPELVQETTGNEERLERAIAGLRPVGQTALWESLVYSLVEIQGAPGKKALVVYTDGADEDEDFSYRTALRFSRRVGVPIYIILTNNEIVRTGGKGLGVRRFLGRVEKLSEEVGGRVFIVREGADLSKVYKEIGEELRSQYLLAYYSKDLPEETWRNVKVETTRSDLKARTITGTYR